MALDATVGGANSNSLLTLVEAAAIAAEHPYSAAYTTLASDSIKEMYLIRATRLFVARVCLLGTATTSIQALPFPRTGLLTRNGYDLSSTIIPYEAKLAVFELALFLASSPTSDPMAELLQFAQGLTSLKAGSVAFTFDSDFKMRSVPETVRLLLVPSWLCENEVPEPTYATITFFP